MRIAPVLCRTVTRSPVGQFIFVNAALRSTVNMSETSIDMRLKADVALPLCRQPNSAALGKERAPISVELLLTGFNRCPGGDV